MLWRTVGSPGGCWPKDALTRLWNGPSEPENWIRLASYWYRSWRGFCSPHVATTKPFRELHATLAVTTGRRSCPLVSWILSYRRRKTRGCHPTTGASCFDQSHGSPGVIGVLARAYGHAGRRSEALRLIDELNRRRQKGYVPTAPFVQAYVGLGRLRRGICLVRTSVPGEVQYFAVDQSGALPRCDAQRPSFSRT